MKKTLGLLIAIALVIVAISAVVDVGRAYAANNGSDTQIAVSAYQSISTPEMDDLLFMREEEKLARDVYLTLYEQWHLSIFKNIAASESAHMDAILALLENYGIDDPAAGKAVGEFTDPDLQALFDQLVIQGGQSLVEALKVGSAIEEIDILDLEERIAQTDRADITLVYESLLKGSRNHLRSFTKTLAQQTGETYVPQYLSQDSYDAIVLTGIESGNGINGNRNGSNNTGNANNRVSRNISNAMSFNGNGSGRSVGR
jgi:hypothetical protein